MKHFLLLATLFASLSASAAEHKLLTVTNDSDEETTIISVITDNQGQAVSLKKTTHGNSLVVGSQDYTLATARQGAVLFKEDKYEVIRLKLDPRFEPIYGGPLKLDYMVNGLTGSRRSVELEASQEGAKWVVKNQGRTVTKAHVVANKVLGKKVGVSQIKF